MRRPFTSFFEYFPPLTKLCRRQERTNFVAALDSYRDRLIMSFNMQNDLITPIQASCHFEIRRVDCELFRIPFNDNGNLLIQSGRNDCVNFPALDPEF